MAWNSTHKIVDIEDSVLLETRQYWTELLGGAVLATA